VRSIWKPAAPSDSATASMTLACLTGTRIGSAGSFDQIEFLARDDPGAGVDDEIGLGIEPPSEKVKDQVQEPNGLLPCER